MSCKLPVLWILVLAAAMAGCTASPPAKALGEVGTATASDAASDMAADTPGVAQDVDAGQDGDGTGPDSAATEPSACAKACAQWGACMPQPECLAACASDPCATTCLTDPAVKTCESAADCLDLAAGGAPWQSGPAAAGWRVLAGDPLVPVEGGVFSVQEHWNGRNSFVFLLTQDGFAYSTQLWKTNLKAFLKASPTNVHYTFFAVAGKDAAAAQKLVDSQRDAFSATMESLTPLEQCRWWRRLHFANAPLQKFGGPLAAQITAVGGQASFGIDRAQQWRQIGLLQTVGGAPDLKLLTYEPRYWNFEVARAAELAKYPELTVPIHAAKDGAGFDVVVELPAAAELAKWDTLLVDLGAWCKDHKDENCAEWDYIASASLCEQPSGSVPSQPCKAAVPGSAEVTAVAAETVACACTDLAGETVQRKATCKADGSGFGACECGCPLEIARWITTYHREGRWISDITPALAQLGKGGKQRIHFNAANIPMADMSLRFQKRGSALRPVQLVELFGGGSFNQDYNKKYQPIKVAIPAGTKKVELYALVTGHGYGTELDNCAEFCNHTHHFAINGKEFVHQHPVAGQFMGCAEAVDTDGAIPCQFGTWYLGRGGWCPGQDVKPYRIDVTAAVKVGGDNTLTYKGLFNGQDYVPKPNPKQQGGFGASINLRSWLVLYQ